MGDVRMAIRDASWYSRPDGTSPKVYHVVVAPGFVAACNANVPLDSYSEVGVSSTSAGMRCHRPACLNRWAAAAGEQTPEGPQHG